MYTSPELESVGIGHSQDLVYLDEQWVRYDFGLGLNYPKTLEDSASYGFLVFTDIFRDNSESDSFMWKYQVDNNMTAPFTEEKFAQNMLKLHDVLDFREN